MSGATQEDYLVVGREDLLDAGVERVHGGGGVKVVGGLGERDHVVLLADARAYHVALCVGRGQERVGRGSW